MNRELIKKYKKEFDHWLDGGEVLYKYTIDKDWTEASHSHKWPYEDNVFYVINDEYVELRKALAEGKTIEYNHGRTNEYWEVMRYIDKFNRGIQYYRIKPDGPEFKVGDYIVNKHKNQIYLLKKSDNLCCGDDNHLIYICTWESCDGDKEGFYLEINDCKLWTLEEADDDKWVLVSSGGVCNYVLMQVKYCTSNNKTSDTVVPYIGQSPSQLGLEKKWNQS